MAMNEHNGADPKYKYGYGFDSVDDNDNIEVY
jgi:hypothetical protein